MSALFWEMVSDSGGRPVVRGARDSSAAFPSDIETLLIGRNLDVSTPAVNATYELLPMLDTDSHAHSRWRVSTRCTAA